MKTLLIATRELTFFSPDATLGKQAWNRFLFLNPVPCPVFYRERLHEWSRGIREKWPIWFAYRVEFPKKRPQIIFASGKDLIEAELHISSEGYETTNCHYQYQQRSI